MATHPKTTKGGIVRRATVLWEPDEETLARRRVWTPCREYWSTVSTHGLHKQR